MKAYRPGAKDSGPRRRPVRSPHGSDRASGGQDESDRTARPDSSHLPDLWGRASALLVFLVLILIPCLYPLRLPDAAIDALRSHPNAWWYNFYITQLDTFFNYGYSPLPLKEAAFSILVVVLLVFWYIRQVGQAWSRSGPGAWHYDWRLYGPIAALLMWGAVSLVYTPTFYYSLTTYGLLAVGLLWFMVVYEMPKSRRQVQRWFNTILVAGAIVAFFAFLQDVDYVGGRRLITGLLFVDIEKAAQADPTLLRLRMGSLIGHNIGVASFLTFSWFILLSRLFQPAPWKRKAVWAALLVLLFYVVASCQTRGIWIVLAVLTPCHLLWLMRLTNKQWDLKPVLGGILLILIILTLQIVPSSRNPFYSPESPLLLRFTHFTPAHLVTETRLRIAICSGSLVRERPLLGHGLGSFQYVFPPAQADYFATHPHTLLVPSPNRTMRAHSDWLQLVIELGVPGLLFVLAGVYLALRRGWDSWMRLRDRSLQIELTAALLGVTGVMFHALADFPMHVASSAVPAIFLLAVWSSSGRIGRTSEPPAAAGGQSPLAGSGALATRAFATLGMVALVPAAFGVTAWLYSILHGSMYEALGTSYRIYYGDHFAELSNEEREMTLDAAYDLLKRGKKRSPLDCQISFRLGEVAALRGVLVTLEAKDLRESGNASTPTLEAVHRQAARYLGQAIGWLGPEACQKEVRYHEVFHYLGMAHEHLYRLFGWEQERQRAKQYYRQAVRYSPSFGRSLYRLFQLLREDRPPNPTEMGNVVRQIARYDPKLFFRQFEQPVQEDLHRRFYHEAAMKTSVLRNAQPERLDLWALEAHALAFAGRGAEATALLDFFCQTYPGIPREALLGYYASAAAASGRFREAVDCATVALVRHTREEVASLYRCICAAALEKLGEPQAQAAWKEIDQLAETDVRYWSAAFEVWFFLMRDRDRAYPYLLRACSSKVEPDPALFRIAAEESYKRGEKERALAFLERALERDPDDPKAHELLQTFKP